MTPAAIAKVVDQIDALGANDPANVDTRSAAARHASDMADLLCESSGVSRPDALNWLLHSANGRSLFHRSLGKRLERQTTKKEAALPQQTREEFMSSVVKQYGAVAIAKHVLATGPSTNVTEHEFVKACGPDFVKLYEEQSDDGLTLRKALDLIKQAQWAAAAERGMRKVGAATGPMAITAPVFTGGEEGSRTRTSTDLASDDPDIGRVGNDAYSQLVTLCNAELKRRGLSSAHFARVFATIYEDPSNAALAQQERRENRPGGTARMAT
jgi:hypothetical protein